MNLLERLHSSTRLSSVLAGLLLCLVMSAGVATAQKVLLATGPGAGSEPLVTVIFQTSQGIQSTSFLAYASNFTGGVRVALGDINGDGVLDVITAPGNGIGPHVRVIDGKTLGKKNALLLSLNAFPGWYTTGLFVAAGDLNGDGKAEIIVAPDLGRQPIVRVFDGKGSNIREIMAYDTDFIGGVRVAAGDVNGDGLADIITGAGPNHFYGTAGPLVKVFDGSNGNLLRSFFTEDPSFPGGVYVATGDLNGDLKSEIITGSGNDESPVVRIFDGLSNSLLASFAPFDTGFAGGVRVAVGDINGDNVLDLITSPGPGSEPMVKVFDTSGTSTPSLNFLAYSSTFSGGVFVAAAGR